MKVSVILLTFNHERFLHEAIESVLMQKTDFPYELVIAEDCSTDGTRDVIRRYWQRYPDRIRLLLNRRNIGARRTVARARQTCRGPYLAILEGDDYWTSAEKLQRQADMLDRRGDLAMCFHSVRMVWDDGSREPTIFRPDPVRETYTLADLLRYNFIASCSPMYRRSLLGGYPLWYFSGPVGDWTHHVLYAQHGAIGYIDEPMGAYRQHAAAMYSVKSSAEKLTIAIDMLRLFRCVVGRKHHKVLKRSLCRHYCMLARQYAEQGRLPDARATMKQCIREVGLGIRLDCGDYLRAALRVRVPSLHKLYRRACAGHRAGLG